MEQLTTRIQKKKPRRIIKKIKKIKKFLPGLNFTGINTNPFA